MFLLYLDDSGDVDDPKLKYFVLGGVAIFERQTHWISKELDAIASRFDPADPYSVELHGNPMIQGNKGWKAFPQADRITAIQDSLHAYAKTHPNNLAFAVVIEKGAVKDRHPVELAFEMLLNRFDRFLRDLHHKGNTQRGLLVMDESSYEHRFQGLARNFRDKGHSWGQLYNISEVPLFVDSKATRLIQLADLVSYSVFRNFERGDDRFLPIIKSRFANVNWTGGSSLVQWINPPPASTGSGIAVAHSETRTVVSSGGTTTEIVKEDSVLIAPLPAPASEG